MAHYHSPLYLIPQAQRDQLDQLDLKLLRKQLFLRLELAGGTTLQINGRAYDRNGLIQAVESLQIDWPQHLRLFRNQPLLAFIESGKIDFFEQADSWADVYDADFQVWLQPLFTERYARVMYQCVSEKSFYAINRLRVLHDSAFQLPPAYKDSTNHRAFTYLQEMVKEANQQTDLSLKKENDLLQLDEKSTDYINSRFLNVFQNLPMDFQPVAADYGKYALLLLASAFREEPILARFERTTLQTLSYAAQIGAHTHQRPELIGVANKIDLFLAQTEPAPKTENPALGYIVGIAAVAFFFAFIMILIRSGDSAPKVIQSVKIEMSSSDLTAGALATHLLGDWHTDLGSDDAPLGHYYYFYPGGFGKSSYYFFQKGQDEYCRLVIPFYWRVENNESNYLSYGQLILQYRDSAFQAINCKWEKIADNGRGLFKTLQHETFNRYLIEGITFTDLSDKHTLDTLNFSISKKSSAIYQKVNAKPDQ